MNKQIINSPSGDRLVVIPESEYDALVEAAEDLSDLIAFDQFKERLATGLEELIPAEFADRLIDGENAIRVWREYRGLSAKELAEKAGIAQAYLSQLETGKRDGPVSTIKKIADALNLTIDDLVS